MPRDSCSSKKDPATVHARVLLGVAGEHGRCSRSQDTFHVPVLVCCRSDVTGQSLSALPELPTDGTAGRVCKDLAYVLWGAQIYESHFLVLPEYRIERLMAGPGQNDEQALEQFCSERLDESSVCKRHC